MLILKVLKIIFLELFSILRKKNQNNITTNNNIILKPKINISFVNNIKTITTPLINKSRNNHLGEGINLGTLLKKVY